MLNLSPKPDGSLIKEADAEEGISLYWYDPENSGCARYFTVAFLAFWLCGWLAGESFVIWAIVFGEVPLVVLGFLIVWLIGWTFGGVTALFALIGLVGPLKPERIEMGVDSFRYDPGHNRQGKVDNQEESKETLNPFKRRKILELQRREFPEFTLDRVGERQRLSFDLGNDRIEIGHCLKEPEREWLHKVLETWRTL